MPDAIARPSATTIAIAGALTAWFQASQRSLPWRDDRSPYRTWISEIMLQQTQVETVRPYFNRFMSQFPNVQALAAAPEARVLQLWAGLGYYSRARSVHRCARLIVEQYDGELPRQMDQLMALPGIGRYTAGAIASIAWGLAVPVLDGNVMRVLSRLLEIGGDPRSGQANARLWSAAAELASAGPAGPVNEALMELGALVCVPTSPRCPQCPVATWCSAREHSTQGRLPELPARPAPISRAHVALVAQCAGRVLVQRRTDIRIWRGLWTFPTDFPDAPPSAAHPRAAIGALCENLGLSPAGVIALPVIRHGVMSWKITLQAFCLDVPTADAVRLGADPRRWVAHNELAALGLPSPHRKIARAIANGP